MYASRSTRRRTRSRRDDDGFDDKDVDDECIMMHPYIATWPPRATRGEPNGILKRAGKNGTHADDTP